METKNFLSSNIRHLRSQSGMTQTDLAKKMNKDYTTIGKWELGERNPSTKDLIKLADIFNVTERDMLKKNLMSQDDKKISLNKTEILFSKTKDILSDDDRATIEFIMQKTIDNYEKEKNKRE